MAKRPKEGATASGRMTAQWVESASPELQFADQLHVIRVDDRFYLTFGQTRVPVGSSGGELLGEIHPVARLVLTKQAMTAIVGILGNPRFAE